MIEIKKVWGLQSGLKNNKIHSNMKEDDLIFFCPNKN